MKKTRRKLFWRLVVVIGIIYVATLAFLYYKSSQEAVKVKWTFPAGGTYGPPIVQSDGSVVFGAKDGKVYRISSAGGEIWSCDTGSQIFSGVTQGNDGTVYAINYARYLTAMDIDGNLLWKIKIQEGCDESVTVSENAIYLVIFDRITSVSIDGIVNWVYQDSACEWSQPLITDAGKLVLGEKGRETNDFFLVCLNPDMTIHWKTRVAHYIYTEPKFLPNGNLVVGSDDGLLCFNINGELQWDALQGNYLRSSLVVDTKGVTYCVSTDGRVIAVDKNGHQIWVSQLQASGFGELKYFKMAQGQGSSLYLGCFGNLDLSSIEKLIRRYLGNNQRNYQYTGFLFSLSTETGLEQWHFEAPASLAATPAIGPDGTVYIQCWDNNLYALEPR